MSIAIETLNQYWGFPNFRPGQEDIVNDVLYGHDVLALLPTGGGKSICFQVPGLAREGLTLVISPLIALMQDQVQALNSKGIRAKALISGMSYREIDIALDNAKFGAYDFLYTSPERLQSPLFIERFKQMNLALIVVDEAHCISEWGHDFRPSFMEIKNLRNYQPSVPLIALTATATEKTKEEIIERLELRKPKIHQARFERPNLVYKSYLSNNKLADITEYCRASKQFTGIVYCQTRKSVKNIATHLANAGLSVGIYHGGLDKDMRSDQLNKWMKNQNRIMVATNAFGMGIDKPDVRYVLHYEFPNSLEAYFQEAGRAGRDGNSAQAINFWEEHDLMDLKQQISDKYPPLDDIKSTYRALCNHLRIAIGSGKGETYPIEFQQFSKMFNIPLVTVYNSLKILENLGEIMLNEGAYQPTRMKFSVSNATLYNFQLQNETIYPLTTLLIRSYPGIFDYFMEINENEVSKRLKITFKELRRQLEYIEQNGIIDITYSTDQPTITFIRERLPYDYLEIRPEVYLFRKQVADNKIKAVESYLKESKCRSYQLITYFGLTTTNCGKCDICVEKDNLHSIEKVENQIVALLKEGAKNYNELKLLVENRNFIRLALRRLQLSERVFFDGQNFHL